jgi:hypothetical protein
MSSEVALIVAAPMLLEVVGLAAGEVGRVVGALCSETAKLTVAAALQLQSDYLDACAQMQEKHTLERKEYARLAGLAAGQSRHLENLARTSISKIRDPRRQQLQAGLVRLTEQLTATPHPPSGLALELAALRALSEAADCDFTSAYERFHELLIQVTQARQSQPAGGAVRRPIQTSLLEIRALLESPLFEFGPGQEAGARFRVALEQLESTPASMAAAQQQAARDLLNRIKMKLRELLALQAQASGQMAEVEANANEALAWITALEQHTYHPEAAATGVRFRHELSEMLSEADPLQLCLQIQGLATQVRAFAQELQSQLLRSGLREELKAAISEFYRRQGYQVTQIPAQAAIEQEVLVVRTSSATGTRISISPENQTKCEMVGFRGISDVEASEYEAIHCALVEQLLEALRQNLFQAQVRMIKRSDGGASIPVVELPGSAPAPRSAEEKRYLPGGE